MIKKSVKEFFVRTAPSDLTSSVLDLLSRLPGYYRTSTNVYERDWDVLVILDACRHDMYDEIAGVSSYIDSVGSTSGEWIDRTFIEEYESLVEQTAYISGNPHSKKLEGMNLGLLDHVWKYAWNDEFGTVLPNPITDRGIKVARSGEYDRIILHYMQPHYPFIGNDQVFGRVSDPRDAEDNSVINVWHDVQRGALDRKEVIAAYNDNLRYVLEKLPRLLNNVDGTVVVTADHGNCLGEWGYWGHRGKLPFRAVRRVPWDVRECTDSGDYEPPSYDIDELMDSNAQQRLRSLGYI